MNNPFWITVGVFISAPKVSDVRCTAVPLKIQAALEHVDVTTNAHRTDTSPTGYLYERMESVQLRQDEYAPQ